MNRSPDPVHLLASTTVMASICKENHVGKTVTVDNDFEPQSCLPQHFNLSPENLHHHALHHGFYKLTWIPVIAYHPQLSYK